MTAEQYREALRRLFILAEWGIPHPPTAGDDGHDWAPESQKFDVDANATALLDDERLCRTVEWSGKGLDKSGWFVRALLKGEGI